MEDFNNLYNELIKSDRNNERVFKSRLKLKFKDFINIKNTNPLSQLVNTYYNNIISILNNKISILNTNKETIINAKPIDSVSIKEKDKTIFNLTKKYKELYSDLKIKEHLLIKKTEEYNKLKTDTDFRYERDKLEIKDLEKKLCDWGDEDYFHAINY